MVSDVLKTESLIFFYLLKIAMMILSINNSNALSITD